jgi:protocatechuate 3,4-dioxygenase beta subunit
MNEKFYHESGLILKVQVLDEKKKNYGNTSGIEYRLRVVKVVDDNGLEVKEGLEFDVWKADDAGGYAGWHLLDH